MSASSGDFEAARRESLTELYQLVTAAVYHADGLWGEATFDLYVRELPPHVGYVICAGIEEAVETALSSSIGDETIDFLQGLPEFARVSEIFFDSLRRMRFDGDIWAMPEGTPVFANEPILRITAPLVQCALVESALIQRVAFGSAVATRAARLVDAAGEHEVLDFSARRWSCPESARAASRAAYIGGITNTSNVQAAGTHAIAPIGALSGTFLAVYREERRALEAMRVHFPQGLQLAIGDEDPRAAVARYRDAREVPATLTLGEPGLDRKARLCREVLDANDMKQVRILASGGLDEVRIAQLVRAEVPIDQYAVGSALVRGIDDLGSRFVFRIAEMTRGVTRQPMIAPGASVHPGCKQVVRYPHRDVICLADEAARLARVGGVALLHHVVNQGVRVGSPAPLVVARGLRAAGVQFLPPSSKRLREPKRFDVDVSGGIEALRARGG
jgi:nicotinate phosphoribosyltransferase